MRNYPMLQSLQNHSSGGTRDNNKLISTKGMNTGANGAKTLIRPLEWQIADVYYASNWLYPEYRLSNYDFGSHRSGNIGTYQDKAYYPFPFEQLFAHEYYRVKTDNETGYYTYKGVNKILPSGSYIISNARAEGELDNTSATVKQDLNNYTIQAGGWGSFYVPALFAGNYSESTPILIMKGTALDFGGELVGYSPAFNFTLTPVRMMVNKNNPIQPISTNTDSFGAIVDDINGLIIQNNTIKMSSGYTYQEPFIYTIEKYKPNISNDYYYEDIIYDEKQTVQVVQGNKKRILIEHRNLDKFNKNNYIIVL